MTTTIGRRRLLQSAGMLGGAALLSGCGGGGEGSGGKGSQQYVWWDHFGPLQKLHEQIITDYGKRTGLKISYVWQQAQAMGEALQLAKSSEELPDVHSLGGLELPAPTLQKAGWFQPLQLDQEIVDSFPEGSLLEGQTKFDGKIYSFPLFSFRQQSSANWFNTDLLKSAGLDPEGPPTTFEEFRQASATVVRKTEAYGLMFPGKAPDGGAAHVHALAQSAGFEGSNGRNFQTGEFGYDSEPYLAAMEFMASLRQDKLLFPSSVSLNGNEARARWAAGGSAFWFEGPWCPGVVKLDLPQFLDKVGVGSKLAVDAKTPPTSYTGPTGGTFFLSGASESPKEMSGLMAEFTKEAYIRKLVQRMDQPPADLSIVDQVEVHESYKKVIELYKKDVFLAPSSLVANSDVADVTANTKPVKPDLGDILGGTLSGDVKDIPAALRELTEKSAEAHGQAIDKAKKDGAKVSEDDFRFPNWEPRTDYTAEKYDT